MAGELPVSSRKADRRALWRAPHEVEGVMSVDTYVVKQGEIERTWYVVDAEGQNLGRLATRVATILRGKHKPTYTPSMDVGDFVIVINADKVQVTGKKLLDKRYYRHSLYPGGLTAISLQRMLATHPERVIEHAVRGMLPKNKLGRAMYRKLKVYAGANHPHAAQKPQPLEL
jgi:large subunit ribosomal protein L13